MSIHTREMKIRKVKAMTYIECDNCFKHFEYLIQIRNNDDFDVVYLWYCNKCALSKAIEIINEVGKNK